MRSNDSFPIDQSTDTAITVQNVSKNFMLPRERVNSVKTKFTNPFKKTIIERQHALKDISFTVKRGEFLGIIGRNGCGKSTLLKIIAGIYQPTEGLISVSGRVSPFLELGVGFNPELSGRDNVYLNGALLGFSKKEIDAMYDEIVDFAELRKFMDQKLINYSSGMQVRLAFSVAIQARANILLIDEVLAVGDTNFQNKCLQKFRQFKKQAKTVVFVSHSMTAIEDFCDRVLVVDGGEIIYSGGATSAISVYDELNAANVNYESINSITSSEVEVQKIEVSGYAGNHLIPAGSTIKIDIEIISKRELSDLYMAARISELENQLAIIAFDNSNHGTVLNLKKGKNHLDIAVKDHNLNRGKYYFVIGLYDRKDRSKAHLHYDGSQHGKHFQIASKFKTGLISAEINWKVN